MRKDVFCSYQTESLQVVKEVCELLERQGIGCWYAYRDVKESHAKEIVEAISNCKIFLLFEDENVVAKPRGDILNEVNMACSMYNRGKLKIIRLKLTDNELSSHELVYYIGRIQHTDFFTKPRAESANDLVLRVRDIIGGDSIINRKLSHTSVQRNRYKNTYFSEDNLEEIKRLEVQNKLLRDFDKDVYDRILEGKSDLVVLDLGSNDGTLLMDRLGSRDNVKTIIATEINQDTVNRANAKYAGSKVHFYHADVEARDFFEKLQEIMQKHDIENFDMINISMLLLHLENPHLLVWKLRKLMKKGGVMFVRDIDDGFNVAYPDPQGDFAKVISICSNNDDSGFRESGRQVFKFLKDAKYKNIKLEKQGMNTVGMSLEEKEAFFDVYFSFILTDCKVMVNKYPHDKVYKDCYNWLYDKYDEIQEAFLQDDFFFNLGFMIYTAER